MRISLLKQGTEFNSDTKVDMNFYFEHHQNEISVIYHHVYKNNIKNLQTGKC